MNKNISLYYKWITSIEEFSKIKDDWDFAVIGSKVDNPFLLSDLIIIWWKYFGNKKLLRIFILYEDNRIVGGLSLYLKHMYLNKVSWCYLQHIGDSYSNITEPFCLIDQSQFVFYFMEGLKIMKGWDCLDLSRVKQKLFLRDAMPNNTNFNILYNTGNSNLMIETSLNAEEYLKTRGYKLRRNLRHDLKKLNELGKISFDKIDKIDEINSMLQLYFNYSIDSRNKRNKKSNYTSGIDKLFVTELINTLFLKNQIDMNCLKVDSEIIAISIGYRFGPGYKWIYTSYAPLFQKISIGNILIFYLLDFAKKNNDQYIDMYAGDTVFYKQQWCNKKVPLYHIKIFNNNLFGKLSYIIYKTKKRIISS